jgi:hypothetical protein
MKVLILLIAGNSRAALDFTEEGMVGFGMWRQYEGHKSERGRRASDSYIRYIARSGKPVVNVWSHKKR